MANAKYGISMARRLGARVYALPEDIVEVTSAIFTKASTFPECYHFLLNSFPDPDPPGS